MPQKLVLLEISCVFIKDFKLSLILEIFDEHVNLLLDIEYGSLLLDFLVEFWALWDSFSQKELLLLEKDCTKFSLTAIFEDHI